MLQYLEINHIHVALLGLTISTSSMSFYNHSNKSVYQPMDSIPTCTTVLLMFYNQVNDISDSECVYGHWH